MLPICLICVILSLGSSFCQSEFVLSGQSEGKMTQSLLSSESQECRTVAGPSPGRLCQGTFKNVFNV